MDPYPQTLDLIDLIVRYFSVVLDVLFQKWRMRKLPSLSESGERPPDDTTVVVTGPTSGIGTETAAEFARRGCHVVLACRSPARGKALKEAIEKDAKASGVSNPRIEIMELDLASLASVRAFCDAWEKKDLPIDILVNNAGVFAMGAPRSTTQDGFELHLGTNYISSFLLTMRLLPFLRRAGERMAKSGSRREARVVMVASKLHEIGAIHTTDPQLLSKYAAAAAYGQSKLAQVIFTAELRRRIPASWNVGCYSLHPGNVITEVVRSLPQFVQAIYRLFLRAVLLTVSEGARATITAATASFVKRDASRTFGYMDSDCVAKKPSSFACDPVMARWLWRFSTETVSLPRAYDLDPAE